MAERISLVSSAMPYDSMLAAEHIARYFALQDLCAGKRVLDIACGEGYGSALLKKAGATFVRGVDLSKEAISIANTRFAGEGIKFDVGDALDLSFLIDDGPFDAIVSFETIEHVEDPHRFLRELRRNLAPGGSIVISCPNDALEAERGIVNPFHSRTYSFAEFKETTQSALGEASQWLIASPLTGVGIHEEGDPRLTNSDQSMEKCLEMISTPHAVGIPSQSAQRVSPDVASFFMGIWNGRIATTLVHAPLSRRAYVEPWLELDSLGADRARLQQAAERARSLAHLSEARAMEVRRVSSIEREQAATIIVGLERRLVAMKEQIASRDAKLDHLRKRIEGSRAHRFAESYIRFVRGDSVPARFLRRLRRRIGM